MERNVIMYDCQTRTYNEQDNRRRLKPLRKCGRAEKIIVESRAGFGKVGALGPP